jgi:micrococcal nuclease
MRFVRFIFRTLSRGLTRQPPRSERVPGGGPDTIKKQALSGARLQALIGDLPEAKVLQVLDGDTLIVARGWAQTMIRLDSIDCPEDGQHWGDIAAYGLIKLVGGRRVHVEEYGLDFHGRTLATIYVRHANGREWVNVNERMVTLGHAWVMRRYYDHLPNDRQAKLNRLEAWAKAKKVGLWRTGNPIPPWQWRKREGVRSRG